MIKINKFYLDYSRLKKDFRYRISGSDKPVFSWAAISKNAGARQSSYRITVKDGENKLWYSGKTKSGIQSAIYAGDPLPAGIKLDISLVIWDENGDESEEYRDYFYNGSIGEWDADWIAYSKDASGEKTTGKILIFKKSFEIFDEVGSACLFVCGLGYHKIIINGHNADSSVLDPVFSDYSKRIYYAVLPEIASLLKTGKNKIEIKVADGWRDTDSNFIKKHTGERGITFAGIKQMTALLVLKFKNGKIHHIKTDENWQVCVDKSTKSNIYNGEILDMTKTAREYKNAVNVPAPCKKMQPQTLYPIRCVKEYPAISVFSPESGVYIADFGQNMAGVAKLKLPENLSFGQKITIKFAEIKKEDGKLNMEPLREAKCTDTYIAAGNGRDLKIWQPEFTYHGFRYAEISGLELLDRHDISAVFLYTDIDNESFFECGDPLINKIHKNAVMTERSNIHGILTDCPQRDERMGWMNDATVRFEETPYNFDIGNIFPKIVRDIMDTQSENGAITCTAPFVFGARPADPVCSSFLIAGYQALLFTGNLEIIREAYGAFKAWEELLLEKSEKYIINYSYYGDWAGPAYACDHLKGANSAVTPGILMSTGYSYFNADLISKLADMLGYYEDRDKYAGIAKKIKSAFLEKWFDKEKCTVASGSQASCAFALWLGLIPKKYEQKIAEKMKDDLVNNDYKITTGNLCTRYLLDMLAKYGYIETAWEFITRQKYPSYGFMIQNEATTIWERFELKLDPGMNSHNHPMYGAVDYWFYAYLAGVKPACPAFDEFTVEPYYPKKLLSLCAVIDTIKGDIYVRWIRQYGKLWLYLTIPFGTAAKIKINGKYIKKGSGSHKFLISDENCI